MKNITKLLIAGIILLLIALVVVKFENKKLLSKEKPVEKAPEVEIPATGPKEEPSEKIKETLPDYNKYVEAVAAAKEHKKNMFVFFGADWCHWCKKMKSEVLSDPEIKERLSHEYIVCIINVDEEKSVARKFRVSGIPSYLILDPSESVLEKGSGYKSKENFVEWLSPKSVTLVEGL